MPSAATAAADAEQAAAVDEETFEWTIYKNELWQRQKLYVFLSIPLGDEINKPNRPTVDCSDFRITLKTTFSYTTINYLIT